ncbi:GCN5-related N-acetyltransferase [Kribbella flavida DSM 17836]|uniref:GCN5-related N-acetyltransferase n=1 Tax=Kribbella flavida (strain DSM 17836 / JCM 10339 / NBRC 14399) TaxID=479435 RepID=D2PVI2_KRIFD|nr:GNAT family N-acetyltransferase [Kribbella flavida]ADB35222.1 GCN5-related N-acetyltransferase [Kribbella flavida DSM 17836]
MNLEVLDQAATLAAAGELRRVYASAFGAPGYDEDPAAADRFVTEQLPRHTERDGFKLVVSRRAADNAITGFAYGYTGDRGQWWSDRVAEHAPPEIVAEWVGGHFEFVELAVATEVQGQGVGAGLHDALMTDLPHARALLTTYTDDRPAPRLYLRKGWQILVPELWPDSALYGKRLNE